MTEPERRAFNAGLEAAREEVLEMRTSMRQQVRDASTSDLVTGVLDSVADGIAMMVRPEPATPEARRRAFSLVQA